MFDHTKTLAGRYQLYRSERWISVDVYSVFRASNGRITVLTSMSIAEPDCVRGVNATSQAILAAELARVRLEGEGGAEAIA